MLAKLYMRLYNKEEISENKEDCLKALRTSYTVPEKEGYYLYTDIPIMILTLVIVGLNTLLYFGEYMSVLCIYTIKLLIIWII